MLLLEVVWLYIYYMLNKFYISLTYGKGSGKPAEETEAGHAVAEETPTAKEEVRLGLEIREIKNGGESQPSGKNNKSSN